MAGGIKNPGFGFTPTNFDIPQTSTNSNVSGGGLGSLVNLLQSNQGLFGLGDVATGGLLGLGTSLLGGIGGLLQGKTDAQKQAGMSIKEFQNMLGQDVINPEADIAAIQRSQRPGLSASAQRLDRRFGLDSGVAAGELAHQQQSGLASALLGLRQQNNQLTASRDSQLRSLIAQLGQGV